MLDERVVRVRQQALQGVDAFVARAACRLRAAASIIAVEVVLERLALAGGLAQHLADRARQVGVSSRKRPRPRNRLRAWSLKNASEEVLLPSFGKNTWPMASRSPTRCSGLVRTAVSGFQRWLRASSSNGEKA